MRQSLRLQDPEAQIMLKEASPGINEPTTARLLTGGCRGVLCLLEGSWEESSCRKYAASLSCVLPVYMPTNEPLSSCGVAF